MKRIVFIADFFDDEIIGGGEKCNSALIELLNKQFEVIKIKSTNITIQFLKNNIESIYFISNFILLTENCKKFLEENCFYFIYEHDHKYVRTRNPALYKNFIVPKTEIVNYSFFKNASLVIAQTNFHANIIRKNLEIDNIISASTNFWSKTEQDILIKYINNPKDDISFILQSNTDHKNTFGAIEYCNKNNLKYFLFEDFNYPNFIKNISKASKFVFLPKTPETFGRVATECKILNMKIHTNGLLGVSYEPWFSSLSGYDLLEKINNSNHEFIERLKEKIYAK